MQTQGGLSKEQISVCSLINNFGAVLLSKLVAHAEGQNVFISPLSISEPLIAVANGADTIAQQELLNVLGLASKDLQTWNTLFPILNKFLTGSSEVDVSIANSLWLKPPYSVTPEVGAVLTKCFGLEYHELKNVSQVNSWVAKATKDKITKIVDNLQSFQLALINAVYFKGLFADQFKESLTKEDIFHAADGDKKILMMQQKRKFMYAHTGNYQAVKLVYKSKPGESSPHYESTVILPAQGKMKEVLTLISKNFSVFDSNFKTTEGILFMPKFKLEYSTQLENTLQELGLVNWFKQGHFTNLSEPNDLFVNTIIHKTFLEVNEKGAEAAAVTTVMLNMAAAVATFTMKVDRPFIFAVQEKVTGVVMFVGVIESLNV